VVCIIQVVGFSGSGKTSSIVLASLKLKSLGFRVAVIKHTHHDVDSPHRDSWRFVEEGLADYSVVFKGSGERVAIIMRDRSLSDVINNLASSVDVVLIEGFKDLDLGFKVESSMKTVEELAEIIVSYAIRCIESRSL